MQSTHTSTVRSSHKSQPAWQSHRYAESTDSEVSFFDYSSSTTTEEWSGYFDGWERATLDDYCPQIVSSGDSPTRPGHTSTPKFTNEDEDLLPSACPRRRHRSEGDADGKLQRQRRRTINTKRFGIVPYDNPHVGDEAIANLNASLQNSMSNTEDILSAMYSPDWDVASLQRWYQQSAKTPADLALYKIMFSLRYTPEEIVVPS